MFFSPPWIERQATGAARGPGPKALKNVIDQPRPGPGRARYRIGAMIDLEMKKAIPLKEKNLLDVGKAGAERTARVPTRCVVVG